MRFLHHYTIKVGRTKITKYFKSLKTEIMKTIIFRKIYNHIDIFVLTIRNMCHVMQINVKVFFGCLVNFLNIKVLPIFREIFLAFCLKNEVKMCLFLFTFLPLFCMNFEIEYAKKAYGLYVPCY